MWQRLGYTFFVVLAHFGVLWPAITLGFELPIETFDTPRYTLNIDTRVWISQGQSAHNIGGPYSQPNVLSELTYTGINSRIAQISADLIVRQVPVLKRLVIIATGGYGPLGSGTLRDQDWETGKPTCPTPTDCSDTFSSVTDGYVAYASLDAGWRPLEWRFMENPMPGGLDLLVGYQFWQERYVSSGVVGMSGGTNINIPNNVLAITQTNTWNSFRVGSRATVPVHSYVALRGHAFLVPWTHYQSDDIHHLRTTGPQALAQDPSFRSFASGGLGVQLEGSLLIRIWRGLSAEAGYTYWDIKSGSGTVNAYPAAGGVVTEVLNQDNTRRQGIFFGLNYVF